MDTSDGIQLLVPQMGVVEQVLVLEWLVPDGAQVAEGQSVVVVETDKAQIDLEAPASGQIEIIIQVSDQEVPVGSTLARIL